MGLNNIISKIFCFFGHHWWTYQHPKTGLYLFTFLGYEDYQPLICYGGKKRKCDVCGLIEDVKN